MAWLCCRLGGLFCLAEGMRCRDGSWRGLPFSNFCEFRAICSFSLEAHPAFPPTSLPPTPARTQAERWCSPRPGFHHPGPDGGSGRSTGAGKKGAGKKRGLGVLGLTATLTRLSVGFLVVKTEISSQPLRNVVKIKGLSSWYIPGGQAS